MNHPAAPMPTLTDKLIARKEGAIGWVIFNNPDRHNAMASGRTPSAAARFHSIAPPCRFSMYSITSGTNVANAMRE